MAEALIGVVAEGVVSKAISFAAQEISSALTVREDLQTLATQLEMIQAVLTDVETKHLSSGPVRLWVERIKKAVADADILLDELAYELLRKKFQKGKKVEKVRGFFSGSTSNPLGFRFHMAHKIKNINSRIKTIYHESNDIGLKPVEIMNYVVDLRMERLTDPFLDESKIVGRVDDVRNIVSRLITTNCSEDEKDLGVIGIVGMAGQGKTTVAKMLLRDDELVKHFEKLIWTCVSDDFNVDKILKDILQSLTERVSEFTNREATINQLKKAIYGKRFLLVLDDVWNEDSELWDRMNTCLLAIGGANGSRVIVTTRSNNVVSVMNGSVYPLGKLFEIESNELFEKIAFRNVAISRTPMLMEIGERIVKRCQGVPLALKAIASLMSSLRDDELEWKKIEDSSQWNEVDGVLFSISLSFDHLSSRSLKQCFAYCSIFPKDSVMKRKDLIEQWMAHGLLNPSRGSKLDMEGVGNNYFNTLLQRSLFQEVELDEYGNVESVEMHDLVHAFALEVSKDWCSTLEGESNKSEDINVVHLSINILVETKSLDISIKSLSRLRTLILFCEYISLDVLENCKYLYVFILHDESAKELPKFVVRLKHLRYLDIYDTHIRSLPNSITKLYNLQTLRVNKLDRLPKYFENLVNLRHFYISLNSCSLLIPGIRTLTFLRTLPHFVVSRVKRCGIQELQYLKNLEGDLKIYGLENVSNHEEAMKAGLSSKTNIVNLVLEWSAGNVKGCKYDDVLEGLKPHQYLKGLKIVNFAGVNLPSWMASTSRHQRVLHNLVRIELKNLYGLKQIPQLGHLPFLKFVDIENMESVECIGNELYGWTNQTVDQGNSVVAFPSLINLKLKYMTNLEQWLNPHEPIQVFPCLEKLSVSDTPKLTLLPQLFNTLFSLKVLIIDGVGLSEFPEGLGGMMSLKELYVNDCQSLVSIESLQGFRSLGTFEIWSCPEFDGFSKELEACVELQTLSIGDCSSIRFEDLCLPANLQRLILRLSPKKGVDYEVFPWPSKCTTLSALETLRLSGTPKMKSLMPEMLHLPKLRTLYLDYFGEMKAIPDWICNIKSLKFLSVDDCPKLDKLPTRKALQSLTHGCELTFCNCPVLRQMWYEGSYPEHDEISNLTNVRWQFWG